MAKKLFLLLYLFTGNMLFSQIDKPDMDLSGISISVTPGASSDGSVLLAHNAYLTENLLPDVYKVGKRQVNFTQLQVAGIEKIKIENPLDFLWIAVTGKEYSDSFQNEYGLTITTHLTPARRELWKEEGIAGFWLPYYMATDCMTAQEAVAKGGKIIEQFGIKGKGITFVISDLYESWVMCVLPGKQWLAAKIPDGKISVIGGFYPVTEVDFTQTDSYAASSGLIEFAQSKGWYHEDVNRFNFRKIFAYEESYTRVENRRKIIRVINKFSSVNYNEEDAIPFYFPVFVKTNVNLLQSALREYKFYNNTNSKADETLYICQDNIVYSFVAQMRNWMPKEIGSGLYFSFLQPCFQPYYFLNPSFTKLPSYFYRDRPGNAFLRHETGGNTSSRKRSFAFEIYLNNKKFKNNLTKEKYIQFNKELLKKEQSIRKKLSEKESKILDAYQTGRISGSLRKDITDFGIKLIENTVKEMKQMYP